MCWCWCQHLSPAPARWAGCPRSRAACAATWCPPAARCGQGCARVRPAAESNVQPISACAGPSRWSLCLHNPRMRAQSVPDHVDRYGPCRKHSQVRTSSTCENAGTRGGELWALVCVYRWELSPRAAVSPPKAATCSARCSSFGSASSCDAASGAAAASPPMPAFSGGESEAFAFELPKENTGSADAAACDGRAPVSKGQCNRSKRVFGDARRKGRAGAPQDDDGVCGSRRRGGGTGLRT